MSKIIFQHTYNDIISLENLLEAWKEFVSGKRSRKDVQEFQRNLMTNIISLHSDLTNKTYIHSRYHAFNISDPKPRSIHKASVRDRLLHHALYRYLAPFFTKTFISDSYSCQIGKGTHRAMRRFKAFSNIVSKNYTCSAYVLKCDIKKFFANINQDVLITIIKTYIKDQDIIWLISQIVSSFNSGVPNIGLPLGNLTSQLFVNIYMNEFDQYVKHDIKGKYYIRYADDFVLMSSHLPFLRQSLSAMHIFLKDKLKLSMHPSKVHIQKLARGVDFLGWIHFQDHSVLRTVTKRRMLKRVSDPLVKKETIQSYVGLLGHGNGWKLKQRLGNKTH